MVIGGLDHPLTIVFASPLGTKRYAPLFSLALTVPYETKSKSRVVSVEPTDTDFTKPVVPENLAFTSWSLVSIKSSLGYFSV